MAVYDVAKGIAAIVKDPKNTIGKTYQFVGYVRICDTHVRSNIILIIFGKY